MSLGPGLSCPSGHYQSFVPATEQQRGSWRTGIVQVIGSKDDTTLQAQTVPTAAVLTHRHVGALGPPGQWDSLRRAGGSDERSWLLGMTSGDKRREGLPPCPCSLTLLPLSTVRCH